MKLFRNKAQSAYLKELKSKNNLNWGMVLNALDEDYYNLVSPDVLDFESFNKLNIISRNDLLVVYKVCKKLKKNYNYNPQNNTYSKYLQIILKVYEFEIKATFS